MATSDMSLTVEVEMQVDAPTQLDRAKVRTDIGADISQVLVKHGITAATVTVKIEKH